VELLENLAEQGDLETVDMKTIQAAVNEING
jgi:hypothetical protein